MASKGICTERLGEGQFWLFIRGRKAERERYQKGKSRETGDSEEIRKKF